MFARIEMLDPAKHRDLRLEKITTFEFAKPITRVKLSFSELRQASVFFPIVFLNDAPGIPQALLSIDGKTNLFVDKEGRWKVPYVPFFFRMYPFTLAAVQGQEGQFALCLDPDAEHFKSGMGDPLFTAEGKPVTFIEKTVFPALTTYQQELQVTQTLFSKLADKDVITDRTFTLRFNGEEKKIGGFQGVDFEKLKALDDKDLASLVRDGSLAMVYEHLASLKNFSRMVPAGS